MAFYTELPVYKDSYQLVLKVFEETRNFPREYKHTLGQDMKRDALHLRFCRNFFAGTKLDLGVATPFVSKFTV